MACGELTTFSGNKAGQRDSRGVPGVLHTQEEPTGGNQSEGTLAGHQREERKGSPLQQRASLLSGDPRGHRSRTERLQRLPSGWNLHLPKGRASGSSLIYVTDSFIAQSGRARTAAAMNLVGELPGEVENEKVLPKKGNAGDGGLRPRGLGKQIL